MAVGDPEDESDIILYPNPTSGLIELNGNLDGIISITLLNSQGQTLESWERNGSTLNLDKLPAGLYIAIIQTKDNILTKRILKY